MALDGNKLGKALLFRQGVGFGKLPCKAVGDADIPGLACFDHAVQPVYDFIEGRLVVPHMIDIQIHIIQPQVAQAGVQHPLNVLLAGDSRRNLVLCAGKKLRGHHHILPLGEIPDGPAHILLAGAALIGDGGVKEVHPQLQRPLDDLTGMGLVNGPEVLAVSCFPKAHTAQADTRHGQLGIS